MLNESFMQHAPFLSAQAKTANQFVINEQSKHLCSQIIPSDLASALKPLIAATGNTILNQYPALKMYRQVQARLNLLDEISTYHIERGNPNAKLIASICQHRATVSEYFSLLDINNTIDHSPKYSRMWNNYLKLNKSADVEKNYNFTRLKAKQDAVSKSLALGTAATRRSFAKQRIQNAIRIADKKGWFLVFDTLTLRTDVVEEFYNTPTAIRDHLRNIGRMVLKAEGRKAKESYTDCFQYVLVPEYGGKHGRLHFHVVYLMRTLPIGSRDCNLNKPDRTNRIISSLHLKTWSYGFNAPIAVRYKNDAFSRIGWLWPLDKSTGKPIRCGQAGAVGTYVSKYINKFTDQDIAQKESKKWKSTTLKAISKLPPRLFRVRMSRGFGMELKSMDNLDTPTLIQLTRLHWSSCAYNRILRQNAKRELKGRMASLTIANMLELAPLTINLLKRLRTMTLKTAMYNQQSFMDTAVQSLTLLAISSGTLSYLQDAGITPAALDVRFTESGAPK